jgi:hypothetical protein
LNALLATVTTPQTAPVIVAQRLRKGSCGSSCGAKRLVADALKVVATLRTGPTALKPLVRMDSAFHGRPAIGAAIRAGADVSVTVRLDRTVKTAIAGITEQAWQTIDYTDAVFDETTGQWISRAEVAEIDFTAFSAQKKADHVPGRLIVRRIPELNPTAADGQNSLFELWRFHAFFTTTDPDVTDPDVTDPDVTDPDVTDPDVTDPDVTDTVTADKTHRHHAIIEQVHADLKTPHWPICRPGCVHRERGLAGAGGDGVQPHPRRRDNHRPETSQGHHRDRAAQADRNPGPHRVLGAPAHPAPTHRMALGRRLEHPAHPRLRTTEGRHHLTNRRQRHNLAEQVERPGSKASQSPTPKSIHDQLRRPNSTSPDRRWIEA